MKITSLQDHDTPCPPPYGKAQPNDCWVECLFPRGVRTSQLETSAASVADFSAFRGRSATSMLTAFSSQQV